MAELAARFHGSASSVRDWCEHGRSEGAYKLNGRDWRISVSGWMPSLLSSVQVSIYTTAKEMGHGGESMVRRVYGHLGQVRHRVDVVEYRVEQHTAKLGDPLVALEAQHGAY